MHPIIECAADLRAALKDVASVEPAFMTVGDKQAALVALTEVRSQLDAVTARVLAASDDVGELHGLRDAAAWLAVQTRTTRREARRELALGRALEQHADVADALTAGELRTEQARVIAEAVDALPADVDARTRGLAEAALLELATHHDARDLKQIGKRILDVVAPEVGESHEAAALAAEEARAIAGVELTLADDGEGRCHGRFTVPSHVGAMLKRHLLALANPARHTEAELRDESGDWKPLRRRLGEAFVEYVERYPVEATPQTAGVNATLVVTMTLEQLVADQATAMLDDGSRMSAGQARRLACEAGIIPVVLGTEVPAAGPGSHGAVVQQAPAHRSRPPRRRLHRPRVRDLGVRLPRPPRRPLGQGRPHRPRQRPAPLPPPPPPGPRLPLRDDHPRRQPGHLRASDVRGRWPVPMSRRQAVQPPPQSYPVVRARRARGPTRLADVHLAPAANQSAS